MTQSRAKWEWYGGGAVPVLQRTDLSEVLRQEEVAAYLNRLESIHEQKTIYCPGPPRDWTSAVCVHGFRVGHWYNNGLQ